MVHSDYEDYETIVEHEQHKCDSGSENAGTVSSPLLTKRNQARTPIPWRPVTILLMLNAIQPLAFDLIFPFVSEYADSLLLCLGFYILLIRNRSNDSGTWDRERSKESWVLLRPRGVYLLNHISDRKCVLTFSTITL